ncbi:hypothetical protein P8452_42188 [Trifolium repens]|nr:hypothetical protein P8452_42188 [Trifolium repens]
MPLFNVISNTNLVNAVSIYKVPETLASNYDVVPIIDTSSGFKSFLFYSSARLKHTFSVHHLRVSRILKFFS